MNLQREPAVIISSIVALITAVVVLLTAFGLDISEDQRNAIIGVVGPAVLVIFAVGPLIRQFVYSPHSAEKIADTQYQAGKPPTEPQPEIPPPGNV